MAACAARIRNRSTTTSPPAPRRRPSTPNPTRSASSSASASPKASALTPPTATVTPPPSSASLPMASSKPKATTSASPTAASSSPTKSSRSSWQDEKKISRKAAKPPRIPNSVFLRVSAPLRDHPKHMIDLRSDTVTKPTPEMRRAMMDAEVGDDVYGEDPTVNHLEQRAAEIAGKEAALFVPTGTMGNTIAIKLLTEHGQEVICDSRAHVLDYELSMVAWFSGCVIRAIHTEDGILSWNEIARLIKPVNPYSAPTGLIEIENTHNMWGGTIYPQKTVREI